MSPTPYVTRNATLEYRDLTDGRFEESRRVLTERLLSATEDQTGPGLFTYTLSEKIPHVRAYAKRDGDLLVITKVVAL